MDVSGIPFGCATELPQKKDCLLIFHNELLCGKKKLITHLLLFRNVEIALCDPADQQLIIVYNCLYVLQQAVAITK